MSIDVISILKESKTLGIKLWVENGKLKFKSKSNVSPEFKELLKKEKINIIDYLSDYDDGIISELEIDGDIPLIPTQMDIIKSIQVSDSKTLYNIPVILEYSGDLDLNRFETAISEAVLLNPTLNSKVVQRSDDYYHCFLENKVQIDHVDLSVDPNKDFVLENKILDVKNYCFDIFSEPLYKFSLVKMSESKYIIMLCFHHLAFDGVSVELFLNQVNSLYCKDLNFNALSYCGFGSFSNWHRGKSFDSAQRDRDFWLCQELSSSGLNFPFRDTANQQRSYVGSRVFLDIPLNLSRKLADLIKYQYSTTDFSFFLGCYYLFLRDFCNQKEISVGIATSLRKHYNFDDSVGMFVNSLPASVSIPDSSSFSDFIELVSKKVQEVYIHNGISLSDIAGIHSSELEPSNMYETMFLYESDEKRLDWFCNGNIRRRNETFGNKNAKFPLTLSISKLESGIYRVEFEYDTSQFDKNTADTFCHGYLELINQLSESVDGQADIGSLRVINQDEEYKLINSVNGINFDYSNKTVLEMFYSHVTSQPTSIAVRGKSGVLSYSEVNKLSLKIADWISSNINDESKVVCVKLSRDIYTLPALLGILRAGKIYAPVDPDYPEDRINYIIEDSGSTVVLLDDSTDKDMEFSLVDQLNINTFFSNGSESYGNLVLDYDLASIDSSAYIIYTSGSTGKPKGVQVGHRSFSHYCQWACEKYIRGVGTGSLVHSSLAFDLTITSLFSPICCGKEVHMVSDEDGVLGLVEAINSCHEYSLIKITPAHLKILKDRLSKSTLSKISSCFVIGGEALYLDDMDDFLTHCSNSLFINEYGPTEATVGAMNYVVDKSINGSSNAVPIGSAIGNYKIYLLDYLMRPVPKGVVGEIYISGVGLAESYWNNEIGTSERFISNPYSYDELSVRCYKTGDLAKFIDYETLHYIGRIDEQVKINGYRIELGEVESVYNSMSCVLDCVATIEDGSLCLCLLIRKGYKSPSLSVLKTHAISFLPYYMRPAHYFLTSHIPLTKNGKVDRKQLENGIIQRDKIVNIVHDNELTDLECTLLGIWKSVFKSEDINTDEDFFSLGGDSLIAIKLVSKIRALGYRFNAKELYLQQSICDISKHLSLQTEIEVEDVSESMDGDVPLTPIQEWFFNKKLPDQNRYLQLLPIRLPGKFSVEEVKEKVEAVFSMIDSSRIRYEDNGNTIRQFYTQSHGFDNIKYGSVDVDILEARESYFIDIYNDIDIFSGPLFSIRHFKSDHENDALLIVGHHLVVDAYSLSTIKDMLYNVLSSKELIKAPSYKAWSCTLQKKSSVLASQDTYLWSRYAVQNTTYSRYFFGGQSVLSAQNSVARVESFSVSKETSLLSKSLNISCGDIALLALSRTMFEVLPEIDTFPITLESIGRADLHPHLDFSRTVGWFTCLYPIVISRSKVSEDGLSQVRNLHRLRSEVSNLGVGFMMTDGYTLPSICFNYLGDMSAALFESDLVELPVQFLPEPVSLSNKKSSEFLLEVNSWLEGESLIVSFDIKGGDESLSKDLVGLFRSHMDELFIELSKYSASVGHKIRNHTDCSNRHAELAQNDDISNIYPLLPGQDIMLRQFLNNEESQGFRTHAFCDVSDVGDLAKLKGVFGTVINRLNELRVRFLNDSDSSCQVVVSKLDSEFHIVKVDSNYSQDKASHHIYRRFPDQFNLKNDMMIRCVVLSYNDREILCLDHHHIIMDGISVRKIFFLIKLGLCNNSLFDDAISNLKGYEEYFLLDTPHRKIQVEGFWLHYLNGFSGVNPLPGANGKQTFYKPVDIEKAVVKNINNNVCRKINNISQELKVTVSAIFQQSWSALLSKELDTEDVSFGLVSSGRSGLGSADDYVGMYMNIVPVRIKQDSRLTSKKITDIHNDILSIIEHDSICVRKLSESLTMGSDKEIYNTLYSFENSTSDQELDDINFSTCTNSPMSLIVKWNENSPEFVLTYDPQIFSKNYATYISDKFLEQIKQDLLSVKEEVMERKGSSLVTCFGDLSSSEDVVVLLHGAASGLEVFSKMISCLNVPSIGLDSLNFNEASSGGSDYIDDIEVLANIYWRQIRPYIVDKRVSFVGFSQGGLIVSSLLNLAIEDGVDINHVYLLDSFYLDEAMRNRREIHHGNYLHDLSLNKSYMDFNEISDTDLFSLSNVEIRSLLKYKCCNEFDLDVTLIKATIFDTTSDDEYNEFLNDLVSMPGNGWDEIFIRLNTISLPTTHMGVLKDYSEFVSDLVTQSMNKEYHSYSRRVLIDEK